MSVIGYARVSTRSQSPALQVEALEKAGAVKVFVDVASGKSQRRAQLDECLAYLRPGDTLTVWKLDRLSRGGVLDCLETIDALAQRGIEFRSLTEGFDTSTPAGRGMMAICAVVAQMERELMLERTQAARAAAAAKGRQGGRPSVMTPERIRIALAMREDHATHEEIAAALGVSRSAVTRALQRAA